MIGIFAYNLKIDNAVVEDPTLIQCIPFDPTNPQNNKHLINPSLKLGMESTGSFEFTIQPDDQFYDSFLQIKTYIYIQWDSEVLFCGRVLTVSNTFYGERKIVCEGSISTLLDSYYPPEAEASRRTIKTFEYLKKVIKNHNDTVGADLFKNVSLGEVPGNYTSARTNNEQHIKEEEYKFGESSWTQTKSILENLKGIYGGCWRLRCDPFFDWIDPDDPNAGYVGTGVVGDSSFSDPKPDDDDDSGDKDYPLHLDWLDQYFAKSKCAQTIEIKKNLLDISTSQEVDNIFTRVIPVGKTSGGKELYVKGYKNPNDDNKKIKNRYISVPHICKNRDPDLPKGPYTDDELTDTYHEASDYKNAVKNYGIITKVVQFSDKSNKKDLYEACCKWIKDNYHGLIEKFTVKAIDMYTIGDSQSMIKIGDRVDIKFPYGRLSNGSARIITKTYTCLEIDYDLYNPENTSYSFGIPSMVLTKNNRSNGRSTNQNQTENTPTGGGGGGNTTEPDWWTSVINWLKNPAHGVWYNHNNKKSGGPIYKDSIVSQLLNVSAEYTDDGNPKYYGLWEPVINTVRDGVVDFALDSNNHPRGRFVDIEYSKFSWTNIKSRYIPEYVIWEWGVSLQNGLGVNMPAIITEPNGTVTVYAGTTPTASGGSGDEGGSDAEGGDDGSSLIPQQIVQIGGSNGNPINVVSENVTVDGIVNTIRAFIGSDGNYHFKKVNSQGQESDINLDDVNTKIEYINAHYINVDNLEAKIADLNQVRVNRLIVSGDDPDHNYIRTHVLRIGTDTSYESYKACSIQFGENADNDTLTIRRKFLGVGYKPQQGQEITNFKIGLRATTITSGSNKGQIKLDFVDAWTPGAGNGQDGHGAALIDIRGYLNNLSDLSLDHLYINDGEDHYIRTPELRIGTSIKNETYKACSIQFGENADNDELTIKREFLGVGYKPQYGQEITNFKIGLRATTITSGSNKGQIKLDFVDAWTPGPGNGQDGHGAALIDIRGYLNDLSDLSLDHLYINDGEDHYIRTPELRIGTSTDNTAYSEHELQFGENALNPDNTIIVQTLGVPFKPQYGSVQKYTKIGLMAEKITEGDDAGKTLLHFVKNWPLFPGNGQDGHGGAVIDIPGEINSAIHAITSMTLSSLTVNSNIVINNGPTSTSYILTPELRIGTSSSHKAYTAYILQFGESTSSTTGDIEIPTLSEAVTNPDGSSKKRSKIGLVAEEITEGDNAGSMVIRFKEGWTATAGNGQDGHGGALFSIAATQTYQDGVAASWNACKQEVVVPTTAITPSQMSDDQMSKMSVFVPKLYNETGKTEYLYRLSIGSYTRMDGKNIPIVAVKVNGNMVAAYSLLNSLDEQLVVTQNGTYIPAEGTIGFPSVRVSIDPLAPFGDEITGYAYAPSGKIYSRKNPEVSSTFTLTPTTINPSGNEVLAVTNLTLGSSNMLIGRVQIPLENKTDTNKITANGTYTASSGNLGFSKVQVEVPIPTLLAPFGDEITGYAYAPSGKIYSRRNPEVSSTFTLTPTTINPSGNEVLAVTNLTLGTNNMLIGRVQIPLENKTDTNKITANGTYTASSGNLGFSKVQVEVPIPDPLAPFGDAITGYAYAPSGKIYSRKNPEVSSTFTLTPTTINPSGNEVLAVTNLTLGSSTSNTLIGRVQIPLEDKTSTNKITANGTYSPSGSNLGFSKVQVDVEVEHEPPTGTAITYLVEKTTGLLSSDDKYTAFRLGTVIYQDGDNRTPFAFIRIAENSTNPPSPGGQPDFGTPSKYIAGMKLPLPTSGGSYTYNSDTHTYTLKSFASIKYGTTIFWADEKEYVTEKEAYNAGWGNAASDFSWPNTPVSDTDITQIYVKGPNGTVDGSQVTKSYFLDATTSDNVAYIKVDNISTGRIVARKTHNKYYAGKASVDLTNTWTTEPGSNYSGGKTNTLTVKTSGRTNASGSTDEKVKTFAFGLDNIDDNNVKLYVGSSTTIAAKFKHDKFTTGKTAGYNSAYILESWNDTTKVLSLGKTTNSSTGVTSASHTLSASGSISWNSSKSTFDCVCTATLSNAGSTSKTVSSAALSYGMSDLQGSGASGYHYIYLYLGSNQIISATTNVYGTGYGNGWAGCYGTVGLDSTAVKQLSYGESITVYAQAKISSTATAKTNAASRTINAPSAPSHTITSFSVEAPYNAQATSGDNQYTNSTKVTSGSNNYGYYVSDNTKRAPTVAIVVSGEWKCDGTKRLGNENSVLKSVPKAIWTAGYDAGVAASSYAYSTTLTFDRMTYQDAGGQRIYSYYYKIGITNTTGTKPFSSKTVHYN